MIVINFYGGPGSRKSSTAAAVFAALKFAEYNVELVTEFGKELTWKEDFKTLSDQIYVFGEQQHRMNRLRDQVDVIVTDSPLPLSIFYDASKSESLRALVLDQYNSYYNLDIFLKRVSKYNSKGRSQTEKEAIEIDKKVYQLMQNIHDTYIVGESPFDLEIEGHQDSLKEILKLVFNHMDAIAV